MSKNFREILIFVPAILSLIVAMIAVVSLAEDGALGLLQKEFLQDFMDLLDSALY